jgi:hypothetical protein
MSLRFFFDALDPMGSFCVCPFAPFEAAAVADLRSGFFLFPYESPFPFAAPDLFGFAMYGFRFGFSAFFGMFLFFGAFLRMTYMVLKAGTRPFLNRDAVPDVFFAFRSRVAFIDAGFEV